MFQEYFYDDPEFEMTWIIIGSLLKQIFLNRHPRLLDLYNLK